MRLSPETCRVKPLRRIQTQLLHLVGLISLLANVYNRKRKTYAYFGWSRTRDCSEETLTISAGLKTSGHLDRQTTLRHLKKTLFPVVTVIGAVWFPYCSEYRICLQFLSCFVIYTNIFGTDYFRSFRIHQLVCFLFCRMPSAGKRHASNFQLCSMFSLKFKYLV